MAATRDMSVRARAVRSAATALGGVAALSAPAAACPYCALSQGADTLLYVMGFLIIPYVVVSVVWLCMKRILASEDGASEQSGAN